MLQVLARAPNVLILDEPSNDLDLQTLTVLEDYLTEVFEGCLIVVSHDNYFVNRVAEHLFVFEGEGIVRDFQGTYTEYLEYRSDKLEDAKDALAESRREAKSATAAAPAHTPVTTSSSSKKVEEKRQLSKAEFKELNKLEKEIAKLEGQLKELEQQEQASEGAGYSVLAEISAKMDALRSELQTKEERWIELSDA